MDEKNELIVKFQSSRLESINIERTDLDMDEIYKTGFKRYLTILYQPFGGNELFFYDEHLRQILDVNHLYGAKKIYFTNAKRKMNEGLTHVITKLDQCVTIQGKPLLKSTLKLYCKNIQHHCWHFCNEISLASFSKITDNTQSYDYIVDLN